MKTRVAASTLLGVALVALVALATVAVALVVWDHAKDTARLETDRAAQQSHVALQTTLGRLLATLRGADGLVDERGAVDPVSFQAFARAVSVLPAAETLALAVPVTASGRARFEARTGLRIHEPASSGSSRRAGTRASYLPIVAVWPATEQVVATLGLDLLADPVRRKAIARGEETREAMFTGLLRLPGRRPGVLAFKPLYTPSGQNGAPVGYVTASFGTQVFAEIFSDPEPGFRIALRLDGRPVYGSGDAPTEGVTRTLELGGHRWDVTAQGGSPSRREALSILVAGFTLAMLLAAFTGSRMSFERRLVVANAAEREARERAEALERHASHLAAAVTPHDVATTTVADLHQAGVEIVAVHALRGDVVERLALAGGTRGAPENAARYSVDADVVGAEAIRTRGTVEVVGGAAFDERYPASAEGRRQSGVQGVIAVPLRNTEGSVVGVLIAATRDTATLTPGMRLLVSGVAEQCGLAFDRATLFEAERDARRRAELMERNAGHLAAAATAADVARATVDDSEAFGADVVYVWRHRDESTLEVLASTLVPEETRRRFDEYPVDRPGLVTAALRTGAPAAIATAAEFDGRFPALAEERARFGFESMIAIPLRAAHRGVVGALFVASRQRRWLNDDRRQLLLGIAEQTGVALERAQLFEAEREARRLAELLERNASHLAAAVTVDDVAASTVADLERAGFRSAAIRLRVPEGVELQAVAGAGRDDPTSPLSDEVFRTGESSERARSHALAVPLRAADRSLIGVLEIQASEAEPLTRGRRQVVVGVAEQCGLALERARLHSEAEANAAAASFVAHIADVLERATTVKTRVRRLVEVLTEHRATFAAVHLLEDGAPRLVAVSGARPAETGDDEEWSGIVQEAIATGKVVSLGADAATQLGTTTTVLPLRARGNVIGALTIRPAADSRWRPSISPAFAREIAQRAAVRIDNALLYERERDVSHSLQLGLLGGAPPEFEGAGITAAYRAGTEALEVGGDWYDAFRLPSGSIALVVGDVVGHGLEAAVAMGQLRGAVSALAQTGPPGTLLERLDAFVENVPSAATATLAYVELDPASGRIRYGCAGHPPPLVVAADGTSRYLWEGRSAPLGSMLGDPRADAIDQLEPGEALVLYTDGLIERRTEIFDAGLARLAETASRLDRSATTLADDLCDGLLDGATPDDDVCVLTVHLVAVPAVFSHAFVASPPQLAVLRERLRAWLDRHELAGETTNSTVLAVSEAAANAIEHGYACDGQGVVTVDARLVDGRLEITVHDHGTWRERSNGGDRGRGLSIIEAVVDDVSIDRGQSGTTVRMRRATRERAMA